MQIVCGNEAKGMEIERFMSKGDHFFLVVLSFGIGEANPSHQHFHFQNEFFVLYM